MTFKLTTDQIDRIKHQLKKHSIDFLGKAKPIRYGKAKHLLGRIRGSHNHRFSFDKQEQPKVIKILIEKGILKRVNKKILKLL